MELNFLLIAFIPIKSTIWDNFILVLTDLEFGKNYSYKISKRKVFEDRK